MERYSFVKVRFQKGLRSVYKPHSVQWNDPVNEVTPSVQSSLWATSRLAARCSLPGAVRRRAASHRPKTISPLLGLAPDGGYLAICITANAGGLLHHLFTITTTLSKKAERRLFVSVALFRQVSLSRMLSDAVLHGVRTFLDPDNPGPRLPNRPEANS